MEEDVDELILRLFALLTAQLEDCATLALKGQDRAPLPVQHERAQEVEARVRDAHTIAQALVRVTMQAPVVPPAATVTA